MSVPFIIRNKPTPTGQIEPVYISLILDGKPYNIERSHPNFLLIFKALKDKQWDRLPGLVDIPKAVKTFTHGKVVVEGDQVLYDGEVLHNVVVERILGFMEQGLDFQPLVRFLERLMKNPSRRAVQELYRFLEHKNLPIDDEGYFYAYKAVRGDFKDKWSGKIDNSVGRTVEITRNKVDDDANVGCSYGLHAGSLEYVRGYGNGVTDKILIVKIDPADVVSVPFDCNCQKLRTCKYHVVSLFEGVLPEYYIADEDGDQYDEDDVDSYEDDEEIDINDNEREF